MRVSDHPINRGDGARSAWVEGQVDRVREHFVLFHDDLEEAIALVGPERDGAFQVEFVRPRASDVVLAAVRTELDFFLVELGEENPWAYAHYHCGTISNASSKVKWSAHNFHHDDHPLAYPVELAWTVFRRAASTPEGRVVRPSMPILYFGDREAYEGSPLRIVTAGLNPSLAEFPSESPWLRFPGAGSLPNDGSISIQERDQYLAALDEYFRVAPYRKWFDRSFEPILNGCGASYYEGQNVALHTDLLSPVATNPTWSRLSESARSRHAGGRDLWTFLMRALRPHVIIVSVAKRYLHPLSQVPVDQWTELFRIERENPFVVREILRDFAGREALVVFGRAAELPFGTVSTGDKQEIGKHIAERAAAIWGFLR